jgi:tetratricopeptide (TPR) repeat protein
MKTVSAFIVSLATVALVASVAQADILVTKSGSRTGEVVRVESDGTVIIKIDIGEISAAKGDIIKVTVPPPAAIETANAAIRAGKQQEVIAILQPLVKRFLGLKADWVPQAMLDLGEAYLALKDFPNTKRIFDEIKRVYPDAPQMRVSDVKYAKVLFHQNEFDRAAASVQSFIDAMLKKSHYNIEEETALGEGYVLLGDCQLAKNKPKEALDCYLRVVAIFDIEPSVAAEAKFKAAKVFEQLGNWKRAKGAYTELKTEATTDTLRADAEKQLAAINQAHPE